MIGQTIAHYRILELLGAGGMGEVYRAEDTRLKRDVAIKLLPSRLSTDEEYRSRFIREARSIAALNHSNIIHIYEVGQHEGQPYFVMELVEGESLRDRLRSGPLPFDELRRVALEIGAGLSAAHRQGMIHRDIKPANILLDRNGHVKILDFGLAKRSADVSLTAMGQTPGTVSYMSPEQARGQSLDHRSDIFSYGVVLYEMITGHKPFVSDNELITLGMIINEDPPPLSHYTPNVPEAVQRIVNRLLEKDIGRRYQTIDDSLTDIRHLGRVPSPEQMPHVEPKSSASAHRMWIAIIAVVILVAGTVGLFWLFRTRTPAQSTSRVADQTPQEEVEPSLPAHPVDSQVTVDSNVVENATAADTPVVQTPPQPDPSQVAAVQKLQDQLRAAKVSVDSDDLSLQEYHRGLAIERMGDSLRNANEWDEAATNYRESLGLYAEALKIGRFRDSSQAHAAIEQFWQSLAQHDFDQLRVAYPTMSKDREGMWQQFVRQSKDLHFDVTLDDFNATDRSITASTFVRMDFEDARGKRTERVRYSVQLKESDGSWVIESMEQRN